MQDENQQTDQLQPIEQMEDTPDQATPPEQPEQPLTDEAPAEPVDEPVSEPASMPEPAAEPVADPAAKPADKPAVDPEMPSTKKKLLLVEDDEALAAVYRSRLELEDFEIYQVNNGEQALQAAKEFKPDLILLDAMMPKISGFDVLDILRHTPETANIRVIMLTALSQPKDKERAESLGVDDYLVKSQVVIGDVVDRVKHHLGMQ